MLIPRSVLAARKCSDATSSRYALGGVHFTRDAATDQPYAVATDGRKLVALTWQEPDAAEYPAGENFHAAPRPETAAAGFTIPTAALDKVAACKLGMKSPKKVLHYVAVQEPAATDNTAPMIVSSIDETARFEPRLQEGRFPRWRDVAPAPSARNVNVCLDARHLIALLETIIAHTGSKDGPAAVVISLDPENAPTRPLVITAAAANGNKAIGVVMPFGDGKRPANQWQAEPAAVDDAADTEVEPIAEVPAAAEVEPPAAEVPSPAPEVAAEIPPPPPAPEPVDNRPIGRRPRSPRPARRELVTVAGRAYDNDEASNY